MKRMSAAGLVLGLLILTCRFPAAAGTPPRAQLTQFACQHALDPANRTVWVRAVMRPVAGTRRLAVRFDLLARVAGSATAQTVVRAGDLGVWISPRTPTLGRLPGDVWQLDKVVYNLDAPASYRFRVTFRWIGARGRVIATTVRTSRACRQPELRPDLLVQSISVSPIAGQPGRDRYTAVIVNQGATGAGPFQVLFAPGDSSSPSTRTVAFLGAHRARQASFVGPPCDPASPPTVTADATSQIDDYVRANNVRTVVCPS